MIRHEHVIVRAEVGVVPTQGHGEILKQWMADLIKDLDMVLLNGPHASWVGKEGNVGWTCMALIETSHVVIHIWNETGLVQFDFYTCGVMDLGKVFKALQVFSPTKMEYKFLDREHSLLQLDHSVKFLDAGQSAA